MNPVSNGLKREHGELWQGYPNKKWNGSMPPGEPQRNYTERLESVEESTFFAGQPVSLTAQVFPLRDGTGWVQGEAVSIAESPSQQFLSLPLPDSSNHVWSSTSPIDFTASFLPPFTTVHLKNEDNESLPDFPCQHSVGDVEEPCSPVPSSAGSGFWKEFGGQPYLLEDGLLLDASSIHGETELHEVDLGISPQEEFCFGLIDSARFIPWGKFQSLKGRAHNTQTSRQLFTLRYRTDRVTLLDNKEKEIGVMDVTHGELMKMLKMEARSFRYEAYVVEPVNQSEGLTKNNGLPVEINVYGNTEDMQIVGTCLSDAEIYLQEPEYMENPREYRNPHVYSEDDRQTPFFRRQDFKDLTNIQRDVEEIIYTSDDTAPQMPFTCDSRIKSTLCRHQIRGILFMLIHEAERPYDDQTRLLQRLLGAQKILSSNKLARAKGEKRGVGCRGGLLADDMGMGKSLTVLALVLHTQTDALNFPKDALDDNVSDPRQRLRATLITAPKSSRGSMTTVPLFWLTELRHLLPESLTVVVYHGSQRWERSTIEGSDIVVTTYETIAVERSSDAGLLKQYAWFRVVLDEAHWIRNTSTLAFKAVEELEAQRRWCLTGTPVQNRLSDLFSLAKFLRYHPFSDPLTARDLIIQPLQLGNRNGLDILRLMMQLFSLRRIKDLNTVPKRRDRVVPVILSDLERHHYDHTRKQAVTILSKMAGSNRSKRSHIVLQTILRLRQICSHGVSNPYAEGNAKYFRVQEARECDSCQAKIMGDHTSQKHFIGRCSHIYCQSCHLRLHKSIGNHFLDALGICPTCGHTQGTVDDATYPGETEAAFKTHEAQNDQTLQLSSKLTQLMHNLTSLNQTALRDPFLSEKSLVFSYWRTTLDILGENLTANGLLFERMDGSMSIDRRTRSIQNFQTDPNIGIMLLTPGTGAVGLNLTAASQVHLVEPHWNPMLEEQAASRVHRIGQRREVTVNRYIVENSIEEKVRATQTRKLHLVDLSNHRDAKLQREDSFDGENHDTLQMWDLLE